MTILPKGDRKLVQIVDAALADAAQRSGQWLACKLGCTQCCTGVFAISQLDAARLRVGLADLEKRDAKRAERLRKRIKASIRRLREGYPGDPATGRLAEGEEAEAAFEAFGNDEMCPVLDPKTGGCDLYAHRPMTCRIFGPPTKIGEELWICELCFQGASNEEIAGCEMTPDRDVLENKLIRQAERMNRCSGNTVVAFAFQLEP